MTFTDASPEMESMMARSGDHCCVSFKSGRGLESRSQNAKYGAMAIVAIMIMTFIVIMTFFATNKKHHRDFDLN